MPTLTADAPTTLPPLADAAEGVSALRPRTAGELAAALCVSPDRVRLDPPPGTATADDAVRLSERGEGLFELVDGTLVEKDMGWTEEFLSNRLGSLFDQSVRERNQPVMVVGSSAGARAGRRRVQVRMPDVGAFLIANFPPGTNFANVKVADHPADLAVEVVSEGNTPEEMARKRREYFEAGTSIVWIADHRKRTVEVWTGPKSMSLLSDGDVLDGGGVLPGFQLPVAEWFDSVPKPDAEGGAA